MLVGPLLAGGDPEGGLGVGGGLPVPAPGGGLVLGTLGSLFTGRGMLVGPLLAGGDPVEGELGVVGGVVVPGVPT
jgi:hypothetical protein